jgi:NAD(P)-dependent dehydrogenase (short-subunit alcohol dehydrogenase family)
MTTMRRTALVTGANKGIGFETARQLAQQGFTVWLGARDRARGEAAAHELAAEGDVRFVLLDVSDSQSVADAASWIEQESGVVDTLINNAGIAVGDGEGLPSTVAFDAIRQTLEVNFYGSLRVTQQFLPLVRRSEHGRIVNVSSSMGSLALLTSPDTPLAQFPAFAYPMSKTMLNALTGWLAHELRDTPIKVSSVCPGFNATDLNGHQGTQPPSEGAKVVVYAANLAPDSISGTFFDANGPIGW